jgi:hypothetical protein
MRVHGDEPAVCGPRIPSVGRNEFSDPLPTEYCSSRNPRTTSATRDTCVLFKALASPRLNCLEIKEKII